MDNMKKNVEALKIVLASYARNPIPVADLKKRNDEIVTILESRFTKSERDAFVATMGSAVAYACMQTDAAITFYDHGAEFAVAQILDMIDEIRELQGKQAQQVH
jgi:hypothetical protein